MEVIMYFYCALNLSRINYNPNDERILTYLSLLIVNTYLQYTILKTIRFDYELIVFNFSYWLNSRGLKLFGI